MTEHSDQIAKQQTDESKKIQADRERQNPRLVFKDPDRFFRDLLMEQQEQS